MERVLADVHVMFRALLPVGGSFDSAELGRDSLRLRLFVFFLFLDLLSNKCARCWTCCTVLQFQKIRDLSLESLCCASVRCRMSHFAAEKPNGKSKGRSGSFILHIQG